MAQSEVGPGRDGWAEARRVARLVAGQGWGW